MLQAPQRLAQPEGGLFDAGELLFCLLPAGDVDPFSPSTGTSRTRNPVDATVGA